MRKSRNNISTLSAALLIGCAIGFGAPTQSAELLYTLTPVSSSGENTITKFIWDNSSNNFIPKNYRLDLNKTIGEGDNSVYYGWSKDESLNIFEQKEGLLLK